MFNNKLKRDIKDLKDIVSIQEEIINLLLDELDYEVDYCDCCGKLVLKDK